jgi:hypothetical protein
MSHSKPILNHEDDLDKDESAHGRLGTWCEWMALLEIAGKFSGSTAANIQALAGRRGTQGGCRIDSFSATLHLREASTQTEARRAED